MNDALRIITLILLATATGGMIKFYLLQPRMPWLAFLAVLGATVSMGSSLIFKITQYPDAGFRWWLTPPILLYSVCINAALLKVLTIKRTK